MLLSVPMIVKNEVDVLDECLASVADVADELLVLDTGSTDDTMDIARKYTPHVFASELFNANTPPERFHFADARNEILARCTGDWVFSIDADESLIQTSLRDYLQRVMADGCNISLHTDKGGHPWGPRIFRNNGRIRWHRRVHETPQPLNENQRISIPPEVAHIVHRRGVERASTLERNLRLLQVQLRESQRDNDCDGMMAAVAYMGDTYRAMGLYVEAIGCYHATIAGLIKPYNDIFRLYILNLLADCYYHIGLMRAALQYALESLVIEPNCYEGMLTAGAALGELGRPSEGLVYLRRALDCDCPVRASFADNLPDNTDWVRETIAKQEEALRGRRAEGRNN